MKKIQIGVTFLLLSLLTITLVSAYSTYGIIGSSQDIMNNILGAGAPIIEAVLGDYTSNIGDFSYGEILFMKFLIFLMLFVIIHAVLKKVPIFAGNTAVLTTLSLAIPIIAVRFMSSNEMLYGVLLPYGVLGIALTTIIPALIIFYFIHFSGTGTLGRRLMWIFTLIIYLVLWLNRTDQIGEMGNQIYFWTTIAIIIVMIFDKRIRYYFGLSSVRKMMGATDAKALRRLITEHDKLVAYIADHLDDKGAIRDEQILRKEIEKRGAGDQLSGNNNRNFTTTTG